MAQATHATFDTQQDVALRSVAARPRAALAKSDVRLSIHDNLSAIESDWRAFERGADCTAFQTFDWISTWHRKIGLQRGVMPVVIIGRDAAGNILFIMPFALEVAGLVRRLTWLASDLCDYNAPLLATDYSRLISPARFQDLWRDIVSRLQSHPSLRYDLVHFEKMPEKVDAQDNPMLGLAVVRNPSNAYLTQLGGDWEKFYAAKRSSATRRRDRTKRKRLAESGDVRFVSPGSADEVVSSLDVLMRQKTRQFANMGVGNIFARPGYPEFYREIATTARGLVHVSRLDVGMVPAAVNLGLTFRGCYYHVLASYDDGELSKFGPGAAHLHDLMGYAIGRGCTAFDFTVGDERYKRDWCDTEVKLYDHITVATVRGAAVAGPLLARRVVKRWIKQTPVLWDAFTKTRAFVGSLRRKSAG